MKQFLFLWLPVIIWCSFLFYLSAIPNLKASENIVYDEFIRSLAHLAFYAILYFLFFRALNHKRIKKDYLLPLILTCFYGLSDEIHQSFVPTRTFQIRDLLVDFAGGGLGSLWRKKF